MLTSLARWFRGRRIAPSRTARRSKPSCKLHLESLEDRCVPTAGALDPTFGTGGLVTTDFAPTGNEIANDMVVQADNKILVTGMANSKLFVGRYNANGTLDATFGTGGKADMAVNGSAFNQGFALALQGDGKYVVAGVTTAYQGGNYDSDILVVRFNANGTLDRTFDKDGIVTTRFGSKTSESAAAVLLQPGGKILVGGGASAAEGFTLVRYNADGSLDTTFGSGGRRTYNLPGSYDALVSMAAQPDGKIVMVGQTDDTGNTGPLALLRVDANGTPDATFGNAGVVTTSVGSDLTQPHDLALDANGKIVVVGDSFVNGMGFRNFVVRYNSNGSLDTTFDGDGIQSSVRGLARSVALQADGKILTAGFTTGAPDPSALTDVLVVRFNTDGSPDAGFGTGGLVTTALRVGGPEYVGGVGVQSDGKIIVLGNDNYPSNAPGGTNTVLARYLPAAPQVGSFTANPNPVSAGSSVTLTAADVRALNPGSTIVQVAFYVDSNGDGLLDPATDALLGYSTQSSPGVWTLTFTVNLAPGSYTLLAQAKDSYGVFSDPLALTLQVL